MQGVSISENANYLFGYKRTRPGPFNPTSARLTLPQFFAPFTYFLTENVFLSLPGFTKQRKKNYILGLYM